MKRCSRVKSAVSASVRFCCALEPRAEIRVKDTSVRGCPRNFQQMVRKLVITYFKIGIY